MTERASIVLTRNRAPPRRSQQVPVKPAKEEISLSTAIEELARAIADLDQLDVILEDLDGDIADMDNQIAAGDEWDRIELEPKRDALRESRNHYRHDVLFAANRVTHLGAYLIGEWRETDLDNIARQLSVEDGLFGRVAVEWPHVLDDPVWQRIERERCPF
jgi:hypothetical protein